MLLSYIYHSGFCIEYDSFSIVIDFYEDSMNANEGIIHDRILNNPNPLYVLVTHGHHDHFNPVILGWKKKKGNITYIFSDDVGVKIKDETDIIFLKKGDRYKDSLLAIDAFGSTDLGLSLKISAQDKIIFHAGDLNNWHWNEESTEEEVKESEDFYARELKDVASSTKHIDVVIFPVDPRLGKDYMKGAEQFLSSIESNLFVPMHCWNEYEKTLAIKDIARKYNTETFIPLKRGDVIEI